MIKSHQIFRILDEAKSKELKIEVNWDTKDEKTNNCKYLRLIFPDGSTGLVKKETFNAFLFTIGNEEEQRKLIPQVTRKTRWYETVVGVKATKDIKKGEEITFPIKLSLPTIDEEIIAEAKKDLFDAAGRGDTGAIKLLKS